MASILSKVGCSFNIPIRAYEADTEEDMNAIELQGVPMGSRCYIINAGKWYKLNSKGEWKIMPSGEGGIDAIEDLAESGIVTPAYQDGVFYTDADGAIYTL